MIRKCFIIYLFTALILNVRIFRKMLVSYESTMVWKHKLCLNNKTIVKKVCTEILNRIIFVHDKFIYFMHRINNKNISMYIKYFL